MHVAVDQCERRVAARKLGSYLFLFGVLVVTVSFLPSRSAPLMHPFLGRVIVNFVLFLICFIAYSSQIFIIWPWYGSVLSVELITLLLPFKSVTGIFGTCAINVNVFCSILVGLLLWNYFLCVNTDPGRVPNGWVSSRLAN